ncbi:MAG: NADPH-dependent F420 reductase, partial [Xanthomonadales bacterium]|nr:NADPH-dependent F420 reductase [Xanthomonadales bacterium]
MFETIAVIGGTGRLGQGLVWRWARAGYSVLIGSRDPRRAAQAAEALKARSSKARIRGDSNAAVAAAADVVVLTVPYAHHRVALLAIRDMLAGKILVDTTVPLQPAAPGRVQLPSQGCAALEAQRLLGGKVTVVSAFQNVAAQLLQTDALIDCDVLVTADEASARDAILELVVAAGMRGWSAGPLANAVAAEALTSVLIQINGSGRARHAGLRITSAESSGTPGSYAPDRIEMFALKGLPAIAPGQDLTAEILAAVDRQNLPLMDDDILVVAQKIISKAEGRVVKLADVVPSKEARERAAGSDKDPALVQLILDESREVLRQREGLMIVEHRSGFVLANAGVDQSNAQPGYAILLPLDSDASAARPFPQSRRQTRRRG